MDCTNCAENCSFVKSGFCKTDRECPFYVESVWTHHDKPQPKLVKDCFPKKFMFEQNNLLHQTICMQSAIEQLNFKVSNLEKVIKELILQNNSLCAQNEILSDAIALSLKKPRTLELE